MYFTKSHEWLLVKDGIGVVGITQFAQKELGEIVYIELPKLGSQMKAGGEVSVLESTKAAADVYSPVSGEVIAVNENLRTNPSLVNQSPEEKAWLYQIKLSSLDELQALLDLEEYTSLIS